MITGKGGDPGIEGASKPQRDSMLKNQLDMQGISTDMIRQLKDQYGQDFQNQQAILPWLYQQMGMSPQYDERGNLVGYTQQGGDNQFSGDGSGDQYNVSLDPGSTPNSDFQEWMTRAQATNDSRLNPWTMQQFGYTPTYNENGELQSVGGSNRYVDAIDADRQRAYDNQNTAIGGMEENLATSRKLQGTTLGRMGVMFDENGFPINDPNSYEAKNRALSGQFLDRAGQAMQGNLEANPGLQRQLDEEERELRENLQASLGPDYATSSPGMAALADFAKRKSEVLYDYQQDQMERGVSNANSLQGANLSTIDRLFGVGDATARYAGQLSDTQSKRDQVNLGYRNSAFDQLMNTFGQIFGASENARRSNDALTWRSQLEESAPERRAQLAQSGANTAQTYGNIRSQKLGDLFQGLGYANDRSNSLNLAALAGQIGNQSTALPWAQAKWGSDKNTEATNINNMWWRNFMSSAGASTGKAAGGAATAGIGMLG